MDDSNKKIDKNKSKSELLEWVKIVGIALGIALIINFFIIVNSTVPTGSMLDTIPIGSRILGLRVSYLFEEPERGDIIVFKFPDNPSQNYVKRIIGLPGEKVEIKGGVTYINDVPLDEPYLRETPEVRDYGPYYVPEKSYFVMGDNRNNSADSRYWVTTNFVQKKAIIGKALFCYWPLSHFGSLYE